MDKVKSFEFINEVWDNSILQTLEEYIRIPNKSPMFDNNWKVNGYMDKAVTLLKEWCLKNSPKGMKLEVIQKKDKTPLIYIEIPGTKDHTVMLYGHLDKQPEMTGWDEDLGPWKPVLKDDKLYGRGGADDGYSIFSAISAINILQKQNLSHGRCVIIIEASEESGSNDLYYYMELLKDRIGEVSLIICLDSCCANYDQMWITTSLRGLIMGELSVRTLTEGIHSGVSSGVVPSCFRILNQLISRIEDIKTGEILPEALKVDIPKERLDQVKKVATVLGNTIYTDYPFNEGVKPVSDDIFELLLNKTWRTALSITGIDGIPSIIDGGNVTLPSIKLKLSFRIPPGCDDKFAAKELKRILEENPPYSADVNFKIIDSAFGWNVPTLPLSLTNSIEEASRMFYDNSAQYCGEGASIPFMSKLSEIYPNSKFVITGILGPKSNAHGPNEFLHIPTVKKLTGAVAYIMHKFE